MCQIIQNKLNKSASELLPELKKLLQNYTFLPGDGFLLEGSCFAIEGLPVPLNDKSLRVHSFGAAPQPGIGTLKFNILPSSNSFAGTKLKLTQRGDGGLPIRSELVINERGHGEFALLQMHSSSSIEILP